MVWLLHARELCCNLRLQHEVLVSRVLESGKGTLLRLMDKILHDLKDPKLWELWYIPYNG